MQNHPDVVGIQIQRDMQLRNRHIAMPLQQEQRHTFMTSQGDAHMIKPVTVLLLLHAVASKNDREPSGSRAEHRFPQCVGFHLANHQRDAGATAFHGHIIRIVIRYLMKQLHQRRIAAA